MTEVKPVWQSPEDQVYMAGATLCMVLSNSGHPHYKDEKAIDQLCEIIQNNWEHLSQEDRDWHRQQFKFNVHKTSDIHTWLELLG